MKRVQLQSTENTFESFDFEVLNNEAMNEVRGGGVPRTRDKDVFDFDEE